MTTAEILNPTEVARLAVDLAAEKLATDIVMMDLRALTVFADYFVVMTADSVRQIEALEEDMTNAMKDAGIPRHHREGTPASGWVLLDFADVIIHQSSGRKSANFSGWNGCGAAPRRWSGFYNPLVGAAGVLQRAVRAEEQANLALRRFQAVGAVTMLRPMSTPKSPRIVPGDASPGLVAPIVCRASATASLASQIIATMGPEVMKDTRDGKKGRLTCSA